MTAPEIYNGAEERERRENVRASKSAALALNSAARAVVVWIARDGVRTACECT